MPLEEIDMTEIDSAFSDKIIEEEYQKILELLPKSSEIKTGDILHFKSKLWEKVNFQVPLEKYSFFLEGFPSKNSMNLWCNYKDCIEFLSAIRF